MLIFDFISQQELDDLPDDPSMAFMAFVRHAQLRLAKRISELDDESGSGFEAILDARHGFLNVVVAAAKRFGVEPFVSLDVPRLGHFDDKAYRQFQADLDHYMTQLLIDNSVRSKRESLPIPPKVKDRINAHLHNLKDCVAKSSIGEAKKAALLKKLDEFQAELEKRRVSLLSVAWITIEILAIPGALWASADIATKLVTNVLMAVGEAKAADDETRALPPSSPPAALLPPRKDSTPATPKGEFDDEIPF